MTRARLEGVASGALGERLRARLRRRYPGRSADEIEDAVQEAYARAATACTADDRRAVYAWLCRTSERLLVDRCRLLQRERPVASHAELFERLGDASPDAADELTHGAEAEQRELRSLFDVLAAELEPRQRRVLALHVRGLKRPALADRIGVSERIVKRDLERILARARELLVERCSGGCEAGAALVWRFAFGLASQTDAAKAQLHLLSCPSCQGFLERLGWWREAAAAAVPAPAAERLNGSLGERLAESLTDSLGSLKQQLLDGLQSARQHVADGGSAAKQQLTAGYYRAIDPTPLSGVRPGTAATVIAGCLAVGGGATYCVSEKVNPLRPLTAPAQEKVEKPKQTTEKPPDSAPPAPTAPPPSNLEAERRPVAPPPSPPPAPPAPAAPTPRQPAAAAPAAPPPPPEQEFEPIATGAAGANSVPAQSLQRPAAPARAPAAGPGEFDGP